MKKTFLGIFAIAFFLAACSEKDTPPEKEDEIDIPEEPKKEAWYLNARDEVYENDKDSVFNRYSYNPDTTISEMRVFVLRAGDTVSAYNYNTYEQGKLIKVEVKDGGATFKRLLNTLTYKEGKLSKIETYGYQDGPHLSTTDSLVYLPSGKLATVYTRIIDSPDEGFVRKLTWTGENITKTERYNTKGKDTTLHFTNTFVYNDSPNHYRKQLAGDYRFFTTADAFDTYSANMRIRSETKFAGSASRTVATYEHSYNALHQFSGTVTVKDAMLNEVVLKTHYYKTTYSYIKR